MSDKNLDAAIRWFHRSNITGRFVSREFVKEQLENIIFAIRTRTQEGRDVNNLPFHPYSDAYEDFKKSDLVDLTLTGQMLNDFDYKIELQRATIFFGTEKSEIKASKLNYGSDEGYYQLPPREFLGVNDSEIDFFIDSLENLIDDRFAS